ncbi:RelE/StbE replicon stabilization toxin [Desulfocucumis palustris]|uniref:Endoribonuclease YoeB n=1 Tax=Desulfocucumis palustris TaxID=1898651 RepID=A0A2L2XG69_9FIRM|nr:Txe/YoeB family addiction module toxin [Desulfocucumis palustris]GBF35132.1 RelE/StbE replicon stabilization toxin [Desulfocucumis palustris]
MWEIEFTKRAVKDVALIKQAGLKEAVLGLLEVLKNNPFENPPPYEKLVGDLKGAYSRRINIKHRLVYAVDRDRHCVRVLRLWTHYE